MNKKTWNANVPREHRALMLRTCNADGTSRNNFKWPKKGYVSCEDRKPTMKCGNGLHGLLRGEGDPGLLNWSEDALWQAVEVDLRTVVDLGDKVKVPYAYVVHTGNRKEVTDLLVQRYPHIPIPGAFVAVGDRQQATAGDCGTATAGDCGTATAGNYGTATAGNKGTATAGSDGTATAGYKGTATAGDYGTATAGDYGTATAGHGGTATAGNKGTATAGDGGTATAGDGGTLQIKWWDEKSRRYRIATVYVGEDGILPNVPYRLDSEGKFVRADGENKQT